MTRHQETFLLQEIESSDAEDDSENEIWNNGEAFEEVGVDIDYEQGTEEEDLLLPNMTTSPKSKGIFQMNRSVYALTFLSAVGGFLFGKHIIPK